MQNLSGKILAYFACIPGKANPEIEVFREEVGFKTGIMND